MEDAREQEEAANDNNLQEECGLQQVMSEVLLAFCERLVGGVGSAVCVEDFDDEGDYTKGGDYSAWVDGGMVRDVV